MWNGTSRPRWRTRGHRHGYGQLRGRQLYLMLALVQKHSGKLSLQRRSGNARQGRSTSVSFRNTPFGCRLADMPHTNTRGQHYQGLVPARNSMEAPQPLYRSEADTH